MRFNADFELMVLNVLWRKSFRVRMLCVSHSSTIWPCALACFQPATVPCWSNGSSNSGHALITGNSTRALLICAVGQPFGGTDPRFLNLQ